MAELHEWNAGELITAEKLNQYNESIENAINEVSITCQDLKTSLTEYNPYNALGFFTNRHIEGYGLTYTLNSDGSYLIAGEMESHQSDDKYVCYSYYQFNGWGDSIPIDLNKSYTMFINVEKDATEDSDIETVMQYRYKIGNSDTTQWYYFASNQPLARPENATQMQLQLLTYYTGDSPIDENTKKTVKRKVSVSLKYGETIEEALEEGFIFRKTLEDNEDLNNCLKPGMYILVYNRSYLNLPPLYQSIASSVLEVYGTGNSVSWQRIVTFDNSVTFTRRGAKSNNTWTWTSWNSTNVIRNLHIDNFTSEFKTDNKIDFNKILIPGTYGYAYAQRANYLNFPEEMPQENGILEVLNSVYSSNQSDRIFFQKLTGRDSGQVFFRGTLNGSFEGRQWIKINNKELRGILTNETDLDSLSNCGFYIGTNANTYKHLPWYNDDEWHTIPSGLYYFYIETIRSSENSVNFIQRLTGNDGNCYIRTSFYLNFTNSKWKPLQLIHNNYYLAGVYDLNEITQEGNYWLARIIENNTVRDVRFKNAPWTTDNINGTTLEQKTGGVLLEVITPTPAITFQRITMYDGRIYIRNTSAINNWSGSWRLENDNSDIIDNIAYTIAQQTINNVTFTYDNHTFTLNGELAAAPSATQQSIASIDLFNSTTTLPLGINKDNLYKLTINEEEIAPSIWLSCIIYNNNKEGTNKTLFSKLIGMSTPEALIRIPEEATGMKLTLGVTNSHSDSTLSIDKTVSISCTHVGKANTRNAQRKYVSIGDSVILGAVWSPDPNNKQGGSNPKYPGRAREQYQISYQIASALGCEDNYINLAIGGTGYLKASSEDTQGQGNTFLNTIIANDAPGESVFDDGCIVTIGGSSNDGGSELGNRFSRPNSELENSDDYTICGAVKDVISYFQTNHSKASLIIIPPTAGGGDGTSPVWDRTLGRKWTYNQWECEVSNICKKNHVGYISYKDLPYMDSWNKINCGYSAYVTGPNYSHPTKEKDYAIIASYLAAKVSGHSFDYIENDEYTREYTEKDLSQTGYFIMNYPAKAFNIFSSVRAPGASTGNPSSNPPIPSVKITNDNVKDYYKSCNGFHQEGSSGIYNLFIPVFKNDHVYLHTVGGAKYSKEDNTDTLRGYFYGDTPMENASPAAIIGQDFLMKELLRNYEFTINNSTLVAYEGEFDIEEDGFLAINCNIYYKDKFGCRIISIEPHPNSFKISICDNENKNFIYNDDITNCKLKKDSGYLSAFDSIAIIGASFDSGEFNYTIADNGIGEIDMYDSSCWSILQKMNGIPTLYHYSNGGENARDWMTLNSTLPYDPTDYRTLHSARNKYYAPHPDNPRYIDPNETLTWDGGERTGMAGRNSEGNGGCLWKLEQDYQNGKNYQAFIINLGSNDINNNYPKFIQEDGLVDEWGIPRYNANDKLWYKDGSLELIPGTTVDNYVAGTMEDVGTSAIVGQSTLLPDGSRTLPNIVDSYPEGQVNYPSPYGLNIVHSYAGYMGAIIQHIHCLYPNAIIFLCTIRNGMSETEQRLNVWNQYNDVLKGLATKFSSYVILIDNAKYGPNYYTWPQYDFYVHHHPNAMGYAYLAQHWNKMIDDAMRNNILKNRIKQLMFNDLTIRY